MKAIVIGATGTIGSAVKRKFEQAGYEVIGASRKSEVSVDLEDENSLSRLLEQAGEVDAIVCAAGTAAFGELLKLSDKEFKLSINNKLLGQVKLLQKGLSYLKPGGSILLTGGIFAYKPMPGAAAIAMVNAALEGFVRAAALETEMGKKVIVIHPPLVAETAKKMGMDATPYLTADEVGETYLEALEHGESGVPYFSKNNKPVKKMASES
ncbi:MAG TPA: short chain dehydrogenase [Mariniphaga sp.]|nr:short chain dehydrogenase [Mariniphaga sp.]